MSTTAPVTWTIVPVTAAGAVATMDNSFVGAASPYLPLLLPAEGVRAGGDIRDFARDLRLPRLVVRERQIRDKIARVLRRVPHRHHPRRVLGRDRLQDRLIELDFDKPRQQTLQHRRR